METGGMPESNNGFNDVIQSVQADSNLPTSQGPFEQAPAVASLDNMREAGMNVIGAQEIANKANQELEAIMGVSPEVSAAANKALQSSVDSLSKQAQRSDRQSKFWGTIRALSYQKILPPEELQINKDS